MNDNPTEPDLTTHLRVGMRIVARSRLVGSDASAGGSGGAPSLTDTLGQLVSIDAEHLVIETRRGPVTIARSLVVAAKEVPPAPSRRGHPHLAISMGDLEELMVGGMPGLEQEWFGRWLLRAANGYTGRANSLLPLGDPGVPLSDAMAFVERWYDARGLSPLVQLFGPAGFDPAADDIGAWAVEHGWTVFQKTLVMTASSAALAGAAVPDVRVDIRTEPDELWRSGTTTREQEHAETFGVILERISDQAFLTVTDDDGAVSAIGRMAFNAGWAGVFAVHVQPALRGRGWGRAVMAAAGREAVARRARSTYLQVSADNTAAVGLYESMGFVTHHEYWYAKRD